MSVNTIQTAAVIQSELDKAAVEQATSGWMEVNSNLVKYNGGSEVKIPELSMDGLADYDRQNGFVGGVTAAVLQSLKESEDEIDAKVCKCNGAAECKKALLLMKAGRLPEDFIEGMVCEGGCVGGPSAFNDQISSKKNRDALISNADGRGIHENLKNYDMDSFSMHRE